MDEIYKRRSIRSFKDEIVEDKDIEAIIKAGMNAPSAKNNEPWQFIVIKDKDTLFHLSTIKLYGKMLKEAACAIVLVVKPKMIFWQQDMAACCENMLLEATHLDLGSCWCGVKPLEREEERLRDFFSVPDDYYIFGLVALGYADEEKEYNNKFNKSLIHYETW